MPRETKVALLTAKLEASELRHRVSELEAVITQLQLELKESNALLRKQRLPPRIKTTPVQRMQIAARQGWRCMGENCPLKLFNGGFFTAEALFDVDHIQPWAESGRHIGNLRCLCAHCHSVVTRKHCDEKHNDDRFD